MHEPTFIREDANGVFVKRGFCILPKTAGFDENGENDECAFCPRKQGVCSPTPENDENDENGACHACTGPVCQKPCLHAPDLWHTNSDFYGIRTPTFMPYEPFLLGVGVVFNLLTLHPKLGGHEQ